jgi:RNA polymerase sigma factor (sigma-70 family)
VENLDLVRALERLSADDRALLVMRYVAGLNSTELAGAFRMSASGLRRRLARLLDILRTELRDA